MLRYLDDETTLARYLEVKAEIKRLESELKELQPQILSALWEEPDNQTEYAGFELSIGTRRTYTYSYRVRDMEKAVREQKKEEERQGTAELTRHTSFVIVRTKRSDPTG